MAENYGTLEGTLDEHGELSGEMSDRATLEGEIQFGSGGGGVLDVFQNGQSVVEGRKAYVTVPTLLRELRSDDYHNTVTTLEIQNWNGKADTDDIPTALSQLENDDNYVQDADYVHTDNNFTDEDKAAIGGIPENITDLSDVEVSNIQNGQVLKWDSTQNKFVNANESGGGGDVTDVKVDGISVVDPITGEADIDLSGKADKALDAVAGDFAVLLANGNYANSGKSANDMASKAEMSVSTSGTQTTVQLKNGTSATINNPTITIQKNGQNVDTFTLNQTTNKVIDISVPTKTSDLQNDSSFITNTVDNLANYYLKSDTYTQTEVNNLISAAVNGRFEKVTTLPASGEPNVIYLVPKTTALTNNVYDEYIWQDNAWELLGSTEIDLSNYVTTTDLSTALADYVTSSTFNTTIANYYTKTEVGNLLDGKVDKVSGKGLSTYDYDATAKGIVDNVTTNLAGKVDKVNGKGLSTEDYTTTEKNKLAGISTGANKVESSTTNGNIKIDGTETQVYDGSGKVDKVNGKGLSTNDYDNTDKAKVDMIDNTTTSATGNPISIADLKSAQIAVNPVITFEPIQAGSGAPSPSNIRAISGYDKIEVLSCGGGDLQTTFSGGRDAGTGAKVPINLRVCTSNFTKVNAGEKYLVRLERTNATQSGKTLTFAYNFWNNNSETTNIRLYDSGWTGVMEMLVSYSSDTYLNVVARYTDDSIIDPSEVKIYIESHKTTDLSESLGQTVYWGELDARTGKFKVLGTIYDLGDLNYVYTSGIFLTTSISALKKSGADSLYAATCYEYVSNGGLGIEDYKIADSSTSSYAGALIIHDSRYTDAPTFKTAITGQKIVYKLVTPFTIQLTPHEIALSQGYNYISTNGTSISLAYHNGELASLADVSQLGETVNELGDKSKSYTDSVASGILSIIPQYSKVPIAKNSTISLTVGSQLRGSKVYLITNSTNVSRLAVIATVNASSPTGVVDLVTPTYMTAAISSGALNVTNNTNYNLSLNLYEFEGG